jgi:nucleoid-associated protein YgaU
METTMAEEECMGATTEVKNAIYAAKLKNARARNLGFEWRDTAKLIDSAQKAADECDNARAKTLADKAEQQASAAIAQYHADQEMQVEVVVVETSMSYLVVSGDNLWSIAGQDGIYGNPYQWPLIYKANSGQIKDADLIFAGQYFDIPQAMDSEVAAAIEHARTRGAWVLGETEASDLDYLSQ